MSSPILPSSVLPPPILEVVIYQIKPAHLKNYQQHGLPKFKKLVKSMDGFHSYQTLASCNQQGLLIDLVRWKSLEHAVIAAESVQKIQNSPDYANYLDAFEKVNIFHHFQSLKGTSQSLADT
ncbi:antibiotic biosynthesis monooxygenase family protein [Aliikangiella coralliicola]|uniref:ABM domain-containing protein n=1 Tax=Aliikangiella coralliicola TaxID=2592383 RepID=A0A545UF48_9GAMM|nr:hypothetical protein [Aliikangiella coralliicola]TQV88106.1 hypothetical protein FLL46_06150 [Aliikangiella coralliicola]